MRTNGVLFEQLGLCYLLGKDSRTVPIDTPNSISDFIILAEQYHVDVIWLMPGSPLSQTIDWEFIGNHDRGKFSVFPDQPMKGTRKKKPSYIRIRRARIQAFQKEYHLAIPENEDWLNSGKTWRCPTPQTLLQTVKDVEVEYPDFGWSPQWNGKRLLVSIHEKRHWQIVDTVVDDRLEKALDNSVQRPNWVVDRSLFRRKKWAIGADKNGEYVGGTRSVKLGNGQHSRAQQFDEKLPGLWYVQVQDVKKTIFDSYQSFCPFIHPRQWLSTDLVIAARAVGIQCEILDGIVWTEYGTYMDEWGKTIWKHREAYFDTTRFPDDVARSNASGTAKQIGNSFIGLVAAARKLPGQGIYRPDWNTMIIHKAISNLLYSINSRHEKHGILPALLARGDTQWILCDDPGNIPGLFDHAQEQRGWKPIGHPVRMDRKIAGMFLEREGSDVKANEQKAARIAEYLEQRAKE